MPTPAGSSDALRRQIRTALDDRGHHELAQRISVLSGYTRHEVALRSRSGVGYVRTDAPAWDLVRQVLDELGVDVQWTPIAAWCTA